MESSVHRDPLLCVTSCVCPADWQPSLKRKRKKKKKRKKKDKPTSSSPPPSAMEAAKTDADLQKTRDKPFWPRLSKEEDKSWSANMTKEEKAYMMQYKRQDKRELAYRTRKRH